MKTQAQDDTSTHPWQESVAQLREDIAQLAESLRELVSERAADGMETVSKTVRKGRAQARELADHVEEQIVGRPLTSVGIALGVGYLLGRLLDRR